MVMAGCGDADDNAVQNVGAVGGEESSEIDWIDCAEGTPEESCFQGAKVKAPIDYDEPNGGKIDVAVARHLASKPDQRTGALFVNPGGPGASAVEFLANMPWPREVFDRFDIYGIDPRGVGSSEKLDCGIPAKELLAVDKVIDSPEESQHLIDTAKRLADACQSKDPELLPHLGTRDVARDMDHIRELLGEDKISYIGFSYGTAIGQVYADMFPDRVRAMVLDGVDDITEPGIEWNAAQAISTEQAMQRFADACAAQPDCPLGPDPMGVVANLKATVQQAPIPAPHADRPLGPGELNYGMVADLYNMDAWPQLAQALAAANAGDGSLLVAEADGYAEDPLEIYYGVLCLDQATPRGDTQAVLDAADAAESQAPIFGEAGVNDAMFCTQWPTPSQPLAAVDAPGTPPIVVISTTGDPATPYQAGVDLAQRLPNGVLIRHEGDGHTIYGEDNDCVNEAVNKYLIDLTPPADNTTCT